MVKSEYKQYDSELADKIGDRSLIWIGARGCDILPLLHMPQLKTVFSIISPMRAFGVQDLCYESLTQKRVDLDSYSIDYDNSNEAGEIRKQLFDALNHNCVAVPYRPLRFFASIYYPRTKFVEYLGLFHQMQTAFEHKIWVETELNNMGLMLSLGYIKQIWITHVL